MQPEVFPPLQEQAAKQVAEPEEDKDDYGHHRSYEAHHLDQL